MVLFTTYNYVIPVTLIVNIKNVFVLRIGKIAKSLIYYSSSFYKLLTYYFVFITINLFLQQMTRLHS
jgi:hypothetical protein